MASKHEHLVSMERLVAPPLTLRAFKREQLDWNVDQMASSLIRVISDCFSVGHLTRFRHENLITFKLSNFDGNLARMFCELNSIRFDGILSLNLIKSLLS